MRDRYALILLLTLTGFGSAGAARARESLLIAGLDPSEAWTEPGNPQPSGFWSDWLTQEGYQAFFDGHSYRYIPVIVEGRYHDGRAEYRAFFEEHQGRTFCTHHAFWGPHIDRVRGFYQDLGLLEIYFEIFQAGPEKRANGTWITYERRRFPCYPG